MVDHQDNAFQKAPSDPPKNRRPRRWSFIWGIVFVISLAALLNAARQWRHYPPPDSPANFLAADKAYGVTIDLTRYDGNALEDNLTSLHENHLVWLRQPIRWAEIEPAPGQFDWQSLDRIFAALVQSNAGPGSDFKLIAVLHTTPAWARPANTPPTAPPLEIADFGNFARAVAERYGQQLDYYQIWHEPNLSVNWGNAYVNPAAYADLLREAALNIHAADPTAFIISAALAPTLEQGPLNLSDVTYLDQLYQNRANDWFDIAAAQAYGFDSEPFDPADPHTLNFRRLELLRQVMLKNGDGDTPVWATAFGWNALPADWAGPPSPWKSDLEAVQAQRTAAAIQYARGYWPWLGPMLAIRWDNTSLAGNDPARGFALTETPEILAVVQTAATQETIATPGRYPASHPSGHYSPGWRFALTQADIPRHEPRALTISFEGTRLDLTVNRGPYRGYLWVSVDGQPANALPQNNRGRSYVVLYDPLRGSETVTLAKNLPPGPHDVLIEAEGGWGQWPVSGWTVYNETGNRPSLAILLLTGALVVVSGLGLMRAFFPTLIKAARWVWEWAETLTNHYAYLGERVHISLTFALALAFFFAPPTLSLILLPLLGLVILLRPDLGLVLIAFTLSFFQVPKQLPRQSFSPVELLLILTTLGFVLRWLLRQITNYKSQITFHASRLTNLKSLDWAALTLVILAFLATLAASNFGVSMHEWRVLVSESVLFYFLVRLGPDYGPPAQRGGWGWAWRLVDAFVAGAILHAGLALYFYFFTEQSITAEGVRRALGPVYGSPNNLSLFLDRTWPILLAVALLPGQIVDRSHDALANRLRRWLYGVGLMVVSLALYLTFSKGALLVGLPAGVVGMTLLYILRHRQRFWQGIIAVTIGCLAGLALALLPLSQTQRFRTTFDFNEGSTGFFRLKLWQASVNMLRDHWPLGVGLDNFLYQYRTHYILPEAWQEPNLSHPHNLILDFGTRLGIGGIVILIWLQIAFWRSAWQLYQRIPAALVLGLMGSMVICLSHGLVDHSYFLVDLAFAFFLTAGVVQKLSEQAEERN
ncbi:MAG: O-antigen ligase family protein [Anaerolineae bacterium]|nr:O-antigen ligase family protein [Anaerolineae bacterium]